MSAHATKRPVRSVLAVTPVFPMGIEGGGYVVSGAGSAEVDGLYVEWSLTEGGRWHYRKHSTGHGMGYNDGEQKWFITQGENSLAMYSNFSAGLLPPATGWNMEAGEYPPPTVNEG